MLLMLPVRFKRRPGLEKDFDAPAAAAYDRMGEHPVFTIERRLVLGELKKLNPRGSLIDAGCGPGHLISALYDSYPGLELTGLDYNRYMLSLAKKNTRGKPVRLIYSNVASIPLDDCSFDLVVSTGTLHHWRDAGSAVRELHRLLKPGGRLLLMDLRRDCPVLLYILVLILQRLVPADIRRVNGPLGSYLASYTPDEAVGFNRGIFEKLSVKRGLGWFFIIAQKV
jgi:ubiquinone/menaquinone biosynthesis C-methylase UbiE